MLKILLIFAAVLLLGSAYNFTQYSQNDYVLITERFEVVKFNKKFVRNAATRNFKYNRTQFAVNFTLSLKRSINFDLELHFQAYKFASMEYRLFPIVFPMNVCNALEGNIFGVQNVYNCGNFTGCPIKKGTHIICNWNPDYTQFPPHVPRGRYMFDTKWISSNVEIMRGEWYFTVQDVPFV